MSRIFKPRLFCFAVLALGASALQAAPLTWTAVMDQTVVSTPSEELTRSLRGLALSADASTIYGGFIQKSDGAGVREFTLSGSPVVGAAGGFLNVTNFNPSGNLHQPKAIATDSRGLVYLTSSKDSTSGDNARVIVASDDLATVAGPFALNDIDFPGTTGERVNGLSIVETGGQIQLYASRYHSDSAYIERYIVGGTGVADATLTLDPTFGVAGQFSLRDAFPTASLLRGIAVADDNTIFVASRNDDAVYRIAGDLSAVTMTTVTDAEDIALFDGRLFVTEYAGTNSAIAELLQSDLSLLSTFDAQSFFPIAGGGSESGYSGIDIDASGRIYLADQLYLRTSAESRDRILVSSPLALLNEPDPNAVPEPASLALCVLGLLLIPAARLRRRTS